MRVAAPSTRLADVDELDDRGFGLRLNGQLAKQALFLGASHHHIVGTLHGFDEGARFTTAQRGVQREVLRQALTQGLRV